MITLTDEARATLNEREEAILQRANDATPGPWKTDRLSTYTVVYAWGINGADDILCNDYKDENGHFMAHARADVPYLLKEVIRLRLECTHLNEKLEEAQECLRAAVTL